MSFSDLEIVARVDGSGPWTIGYYSVDGLERSVPAPDIGVEIGNPGLGAPWGGWGNAGLRCVLRFPEVDALLLHWFNSEIGGFPRVVWINRTTGAFVRQQEAEVGQYNFPATTRGRTFFTGGITDYEVEPPVTRYTQILSTGVSAPTAERPSPYVEPVLSPDLPTNSFRPYVIPNASSPGNVGLALSGATTYAINPHIRTEWPGTPTSFAFDGRVPIFLAADEFTPYGFWTEFVNSEEVEA